jgi:hypothetical protein
VHVLFYKRRRGAGSCGGGVDFVLVVLPFSAATWGPQMAVARLTSAAITVQLRNAPAFKAACCREEIQGWLEAVEPLRFVELLVSIRAIH